MPKTFSNGFLSRAETAASEKHNARPASNVDDHSYDPATRELTVTFSHGPTRYKYFDVTQSQAHALASAKSRGEFLHKHIIGKNDAERLSD